VLKEGRVQPGRGSLAEVLPASLLDQLTAATDGIAHWRASSGTVHQLRVAARDADVGRGFTPPQGGREGPPYEDKENDFLPLTDAAARRISVASVVDQAGRRGPSDGSRGVHDADRLVGTLVHRLLQRVGFEADSSAITAVSGLLRPGEMMGDGDAATLDEAVAVYRAICHRPDLRALYAAGERFHEVPFTMRADGMLLRGTIDCLIRTGPHRITLLEFKTGRPRDEHRLQLDLYRRAAERLFPDSAIDTRLVYADRESPPGRSRCP